MFIMKQISNIIHQIVDIPEVSTSGDVSPAGDTPVCVRRCIGITKTGARCRITSSGEFGDTRLNTGDYCRYHVGQGPPETRKEPDVAVAVAVATEEEKTAKNTACATAGPFVIATEPTAFEREEDDWKPDGPGVKLAFLDLETTGLLEDPKSRIIEIGVVVRDYDTSLETTFQWLVNPQGHWSDGAAAVHKISRDSLADKPFFSEIVSELRAVLGDYPLVTHGNFDIQMLNREFGRLEQPTLDGQRHIDTLELANMLHLRYKKLQTLAEKYGIAKPAGDIAHRAVADARLTANLFPKLAIGTRPLDAKTITLEHKQYATDVILTVSRRLKTP